ncbi:hypothetical protein KP509_04G102800 [Ceratopteris richardii]|uniref:Serine aminopeptidase S33 domain-containing protein n=1 Tax=Ceratopteris richardii TaxID=49495 RepID=A0A8T2UVZ3_CERRI|nr:hypothetical protein KP509_04G102800 [Ceratopteris richardii]
MEQASFAAKTLSSSSSSMLGLSKELITRRCRHPASDQLLQYSPGIGFLQAYPAIRATATFDYNNAASSIDLASPSAFPSFLPPEVRELRDPAARSFASRIRRLPVQTSLSKSPIMTSCVKPTFFSKDLPPVVLLHGFDSSCLEWKNTYPRLEKANIECWAFDILGWGFSHSETLSSVGVAAKREHLYEFWRSYIKRPMVLVGPSLGGAAAIDFTNAYPEAVFKLVLVNAQGYAKGTGNKARLPKFFAYAGVSLLKNVLLRTYASSLIHHNLPWTALIDQMHVGRLHCLMPGWSQTSVEFMLSGGYDVGSKVSKIDKETLVIWGEEDRIISKDVPEVANDLVTQIVFIFDSLVTIWYCGPTISS